VTQQQIYLLIFFSLRSPSILMFADYYFYFLCIEYEKYWNRENEKNKKKVVACPFLDSIRLTPDLARGNNFSLRS
jgi:hypothetical protein